MAIKIGGRYRLKKTGEVATIKDITLYYGFLTIEIEGKSGEHCTTEDQLEEISVECMQEIKIGKKYHLIPLSQLPEDPSPCIISHMKGDFGGKTEVIVTDLDIHWKGWVRVEVRNDSYYVNRKWLIPIPNQLGSENNSGGARIKSKIRYIRGRE